MFTKAESAEHKRGVEALALWCKISGWSNVKTPADKVAEMIPDVQGDVRGKRAYGEVKLLGDFSETETRDQLASYINELPTVYKLVLGVPKAAEAVAHRAVAAWRLADGITLVAL